MSAVANDCAIHREGDPAPAPGPGLMCGSVCQTFTVSRQQSGTHQPLDQAKARLVARQTAGTPLRNTHYGFPAAARCLLCCRVRFLYKKDFSYYAKNFLFLLFFIKFLTFYVILIIH